MSTQGIGSQPGEAVSLDLSDKTLILPKGLKLPSGTDLSNLSVFNVTSPKYGAVGDGATDCTAAIQAAINDAEASAWGGIVYVPSGSYKITGQLLISGSNVTLKGAGFGATQIWTPWNSTFTAIKIQGAGAVPGNISTYSAYNSIRDININQTFNGSAGPSVSGGIGVYVAYTIFPKLIDCYISNFAEGLYLTGTVDFYAERTRVICSNASVTTLYGINIDGTTQNASCYFHNCISGFGGFTGATSYAWYVRGAHLADLYISDCEGDTATYGLYWNGDGVANPYDAFDIRFEGFVADQCVNPIYVINVPDNAGMVELSDCYTANSQASSVGISINNSSGVVVRGCEVTSSQYQSNNAIALSSSKNCVITGNICKGEYNQAIYFNSSPDCVASNNILVATVNNDTGIFVNGSPRIAIIGNIFNAISTITWRYGINLGAGSGGGKIIGNIMDPSGIFDSSSYIIIDASLTDIECVGNYPFNPRGASLTNPTVSASPWSWTNASGVSVTMYVSGGTVSAISIDGRAAGLVSGAFRVPPGKAISVTYTAAPTVAVIGD